MKRNPGAWLAAAAVAALGLSGCTPASSTPAQDESAPITVLVDDTRKAPAEEWAAAHPEYDITVEVADNTQGAIPSRISLAKNAGDEVPDVVFLSQPDEIASLIANPTNYALGLDEEIDQGVLESFADGTIERCTFGGVTYCLPNDIAQTVLYYNSSLFEQFGYSVPATFDEWLALGEQLAAEHPGYSLGSVNGRYGVDAYYGSSACPLTESPSPTEAVIDPAAAECARVNDVMGPLLANGTLSTLDPFDANFTPIIADGMLLATISPSWFGEFGIKPNYATEGDWAVAPMPMWAGADDNLSGAVGGGIWLVSATSENLDAAKAFAVGITTDVDILAAGSGYPANTDAASAWLEKVSEDAWYAEDPAPILTEQAGKISSSLGYVRYQTQLLDSFNSTVIQDQGADVAGAWTTFGEQVTQAAETAGYTVSP